MKMKDIPKAEVSSVCRITMVRRDMHAIMVVIPTNVTDADVYSLLAYADETARYAQLHNPKTFNYPDHIRDELSKMQLGFEMLEVPSSMVPLT
jgi:hypothetical protein